MTVSSQESPLWRVSNTCAQCLLRTPVIYFVYLKLCLALSKMSNVIISLFKKGLTASQERMMLLDWDAPPLRTMHDKLTGCGILRNKNVLSKWKWKEKLGCENSSRLKKGFLKKQNFMEGCVPDGWILGPWRREEIFSGSGGRGNGSVGEEREHVRGLNAVRQTTLLMKIQTSSVALFCCLNANQNVCIYDNSN